jgi:thymidylate synthase ThyX
VIEAKIIADSVSPSGDRLTTIECRFHRFILPEVNTHRMLSKSAQSSRAIPLSKRIEEVRENPALPVFWGKSQIGMVAENELDDWDQGELRSVWLEAANAAADYATILGQAKLHKQTSSRVLEPFLWQTNVMSSTDFGWKNLLKLRDHPDAQPEFRALAVKIREAYEESVPQQVEYGQWHLPYLTEDDYFLTLVEQQKVSVARVARTSYGNADGFDWSKDLELESRLYLANPRHDAPYEMVARASENIDLMGNFCGWEQLRHIRDWREEWA